MQYVQYFFYKYVYNVFIVLHFIERYPEHFQGLFIALDIWHKSVKLTKKGKATSFVQTYQ